MAKAMKLIRRCALFLATLPLSTYASTELPVVPETLPLPPAVYEPLTEVRVDPLELLIHDMEVSTNFALESIPAVSVAGNISNMYKISTDLSEKIVKVAERNAHSDFPSRNDLLAIMAVESTFNPRAVFNGNFGLMQIRKKSHKSKIKGRSLFDIATNIEVGAQLLRELFLALGSKDAAILAYNVGLGNYNKRKINWKYLSKYRSALLRLSKMN